MDSQTTSEVAQVLSSAADTLVGKIVFVIVVVAIASLIQHLVVPAVKRACETLNLPSSSIFVNVARSIIWAFALLALLQPVFGIQPTSLLTALGVTSIIVSIGLQDTFKNIVGGLSLMAAKVIKPGDAITVGSVTGQVVDVNWHSTRVQDQFGNVDVIPNSVLNATDLRLLTTAAAHTVSVPVLVRADADLEEVSAAIVEAVGPAVGELLDPIGGVKVEYAGSELGGVSACIKIRYVDEATSTAVADRAMRALSGKPWLACSA